MICCVMVLVCVRTCFMDLKYTYETIKIAEKLKTNKFHITAKTFSILLYNVTYNEIPIPLLKTYT